MKTLLILLCSLVALESASAQTGTEGALGELIDAEKAFAQMAKDHNTRDAFLFFFADEAVSASPGNGPITGKHHLEKQKANESLLSWHPVFSDIAASGDFGYNTGPWEFRVNKTDTLPVAYGQFASMWKKQENGEWKVVIDVGISHGKPGKALSHGTSSQKQNRKRDFPTADKTVLFDLERNFIEQLQQSGKAVYKTIVSKEIKFFRPGREPFTTPADVSRFLEEASEPVSLTFVGGDVASSGDLAYVYGKASIHEVASDASKTTHHTYMRFWKLEGGEWRIVLDLISD